MRIAILILTVFTASMLASPEEDMNCIIDAVYRADGETLYRGLTNESQEALSMMVTMFRIAPGEVADHLRQELDVQLSTSEVVNLREEDLLRIILNSPVFRQEVPWSRDAISLAECPMRGDTAFVRVTIVGEQNTYTYPMVMQGGTWRLVDEFFREN